VDIAQLVVALVCDISCRRFNSCYSPFLLSVIMLLMNV
jgi:hypothetical protein